MRSNVSLRHAATSCRYFRIGRAIFTAGAKPTASAERAERLVCSTCRPSSNGVPTERRPSSREGIFAFVANSTSVQFGSFGNCRVITTSRCPTRRSHEALQHHEMKRFPRGTRVRKVHTKSIQSRLPGITSECMLSYLF